MKKQDEDVHKIVFYILLQILHILIKWDKLTKLVAMIKLKRNVFPYYCAANRQNQTQVIIRKNAMVNQSVVLSDRLATAVTEPLRVRFPTRSDTNQPVHSQKVVTGRLKISNLRRRGIVLSEYRKQRRWSDQLRSYCEANLRLWFRICRLLR